MFNRFEPNYTVQSPREVKHTYHNAPTTEQVRLLRELEASAEENICARFRVDNELIIGHVQVIRDTLNNAYRFQFTGSLNGKAFDVSGELDAWDLHNPVLSREDFHHVTNTINEALMKAVSAELLPQVAYNLVRIK